MGHAGPDLAKSPSVLMGFPCSVALAIGYSFSQMTWSPSQPPPGSVLCSPRRIAAEESDQWWEPALKEVGQQIGWGWQDRWRTLRIGIIFLGVSRRTAPPGTSQWVAREVMHIQWHGKGGIWLFLPSSQKPALLIFTKMFFKKCRKWQV